ncbi:MAG: molybdopterin molybdotransferase MoeA [Thermoleophilaceae bacterium]
MRTRGDDRAVRCQDDPVLTSIDEARARIARSASPLRSETVTLPAALGRIAAVDVVCERDLPAFDSSAMDGYAVIAGPARTLALSGEARAGQPTDLAVAGGEALRISTGAALPHGASAVVAQEHVQLDAGSVSVPETHAGANVRRAGEDLRAGDRAIEAGRALGPAELAVLAALGRTEIACGATPRVSVVVTGDELVEPGTELGPGQIYDSNRVALRAQATQAGATVVGEQRVGDEAAATRAALDGALSEADVVCICGGVSVGDHDHVRPALAALGVEERFWGVHLKPGKPTWFGVRGRVLVFGLPGNPVSAMVTFELFTRPALRLLAGASAPTQRLSGILDEAVSRHPAREQAIRCRLRLGPDGPHIRPTKAQGSHVLSSMLGAGALAIVPSGTGEIAPGERVDIELLQGG